MSNSQKDMSDEKDYYAALIKKLEKRNMLTYQKNTMNKLNDGQRS